MASQFSAGGKYFAQISVDGKLKVWNVTTNSFEQEFVPDFHLTTPCTCLHFVEQCGSFSKPGSPQKKFKKRHSLDEVSPYIILGTSLGSLLVYSLAKADLEYKIDGLTSQPILCISCFKEIAYSGSEQYILKWDLEERAIKSKWKTGNEKVTAILAIPDSNRILTASKSIKLWDVDTKEVIKIFTGHSSEVSILNFIIPRQNGRSYFISASKGDRVLNCWNLDGNVKDKNAVASFLMEDVCQNVSVIFGSDGATTMAAVTRSGVVHIYQYTLNGKCGKPIKPKTTVQVASDTDQNSSLVVPIPILGAFFQSNTNLIMGYGSSHIINFENLTLNQYEKVHCLIRADPRIKSVSKVGETSKTQTPIVGNNVHYLTPYTSTPTTKRKGQGHVEVPMEKRLENLQLKKLDNVGNVPKVDNVAQLLVQGLHSNDKKILRTVLDTREENVIRNTVKRLPMPVIVPLVKELTSFIQGKTGLSQVGGLWLRNILQIHAGLLVSNPDLSDLIGPTLGCIESRLTLRTPLSSLRGRLDLMVSQLTTNHEQENDADDEPLLSFNDKAESGSDTMVAHSDSDNEWVEETSDENDDQEVSDEDMST